MKVGRNNRQESLEKFDKQGKQNFDHGSHFSTIYYQIDYRVCESLSVFSEIKGNHHLCSCSLPLSARLHPFFHPITECGASHRRGVRGV